jgi:hypothetical protein
VADSLNTVSPEIRQALYLPGESTVPSKGCGYPAKPELSWTPVLKKALLRMVGSNRPMLENALAAGARVS